MDTQNTPRGVFASRSSVREISRDPGVRSAVKSFLASVPKRLKGPLIVICTSTLERYYSTSKHKTCFTFLASLWEGGDRFKLFARGPGGELEEIPAHPLLTVRQPTRNPKG